MSLVLIEKVAAESIVLTFSFQKLLGPGETIKEISSVVLSIYSGGETAVEVLDGDPEITEDGLSVLQRVSGGTPGVTYQIRTTVVTDDEHGNTLVLSGCLKIGY